MVQFENSENAQLEKLLHVKHLSTVVGAKPKLFYVRERESATKQ